MPNSQEIAARTEAYAFAEAGYIGPVPATVQAEADAKGISPAEAAQSILAAMIERFRMHVQ